MSHIGKEKLEKYGRRELSPSEFLSVQRHVENCVECRRRLNEMLPALGEIEEKTLADFLTETKESVFHLTYEDHLKPFVMKTADAITREMVESHIEVCPECLGDLRDLLEFHETLERETQEKSGFLAGLQKLWTTGGWRILALASVLIAAIAGIFWLSRTFSKPAPELASSPMSNVQTPKPLEVPSPELSKVPSTKPVESPKSKVRSPKPETEIIKPVENPSLDTPKPKSQIPNPKSGEFVALRLPKFLKDLKIEKVGTLLGSDDSPTQKIIAISPNGTAIRDSSPVLTWQNSPNIQTFEVAVFDENDNRLAKNDAVSGNSWRVPNLPKGKIYQWQVSGKSVVSDGKTTNFIGQGKFYIVSQQAENRINQAKDSLEKGKAFAEAGLLREAANEFRKYLKENPNSENVKKILRQVEQAQR